MLRIVPIDNRNEAEWRRLLRAYGHFYGRAPGDEQLDLVWGWLDDPAHEVEGLLAVDGDRVLGLAHFRRMPSPLRAQYQGFLDDLFVDPEARGGRVGEVLLAAIADIARQRSWPVVRWITADDNYRARALYDRVAKKTTWNLNELSLVDRRVCSCRDCCVPGRARRVKRAAQQRRIWPPHGTRTNSGNRTRSGTRGRMAV